MKVIMTCGGTGGHIMPALAIADMIRENRPRAEILFVGADGGMEEELVAKAGYPIKTIAVKGLSRRLSPAGVKSLFLAARAVGTAKDVLRDFSPDVVIGTGGYASFPSVFAATGLGIPAVLHESNAVAGAAVRLLSRRVNRVWLNFEAAASSLFASANVLTVGNPLPRGYKTPTPASLPSGTSGMLLSFGGSLGAREVNRAVLALMEKGAQQPKVYHLHATGKREYEAVLSEFRARGLHRFPHLSLVPFITDMPAQMAAADVVVCRAGAVSISEVAALGKPAVLIPSPNVTGNHQYENAMALVREGAAVLVEEKELESGALSIAVGALLSDAEKRRSLSERVRAFYKEDANRLIFEDLMRLLKE